MANGEELGLNWYAVNVRVAIKRDECLIRPYSVLKFIGDAPGVNVAWPTNRVYLFD